MLRGTITEYGLSVAARCHSTRSAGTDDDRLRGCTGDERQRRALRPIASAFGLLAVYLLVQSTFLRS
jgi:hypothetical protein